MPTIITHTAIPVCLRIALGGAVLSTPLTIAAAMASVVPDLDVVAFYFGIPYGHPLGHRGVSHSLAFAALLGVLAAVAAPWLRSSRLMAFVIVAVRTNGSNFLNFRLFLARRGIFALSAKNPRGALPAFYSLSPTSIQRPLTPMPSRILPSTPPTDRSCANPAQSLDLNAWLCAHEPEGWKGFKTAFRSGAKARLAGKDSTSTSYRERDRFLEHFQNGFKAMDEALQSGTVFSCPSCHQPLPSTPW